METAGREAGATDYQVVEQQLRRGGQLGCMDYVRRAAYLLDQITDETRWITGRLSLQQIK